jgi:hypothetical protein
MLMSMVSSACVAINVAAVSASAMLAENPHSKAS